MSLVGTRPPTVDEWEQYELHHRSRMSTKPGITGMWQVSGRSDITDFEEVVRLDTEYIENWTIGLDVYVADNLWRGKIENLNDENGKPVIDLDTHFFKKDLSIYEEAESVVGITDYVVHLADIVAGIDYVFSNQGELFRVNNLINSNLFAACRKAGKEKIKGLLYVGTVCSFPLTRQNMLNPEPLHEDELFPAMPESAYGWSKLMGQLEIGYLEKETALVC